MYINRSRCSQYIRMKLISFDVGIKNLAYCIFDVSGSQLSIIDWNVLNLIETLENKSNTNICTCFNKAKTKKIVATKCIKKATFCKIITIEKENETIVEENFYCEKHAKTSDFIIPNKRFSSTNLKKQKNEELINICNEFHISFENKTNKKDLLDKLDVFFKTKCLQPIIIKKGKNASEIDLIFIGKKMKELLNKIPDIQTIDYSIIENQISPIANRMKTIQGMLAQYFIMINDNIHIEYISSSNKLKTIDKVQSEHDKVQLDKNSYKENKKNGITKCSLILDENPEFIKWKNKLDTKKGDDLADCFLQGHWYIHKKIIK